LSQGLVKIETQSYKAQNTKQNTRPQSTKHKQIT